MNFINPCSHKIFCKFIFEHAQSNSVKRQLCSPLLYYFAQYSAGSHEDSETSISISGKCAESFSASGVITVFSVQKCPASKTQKPALRISIKKLCFIFAVTYASAPAAIASRKNSAPLPPQTATVLIGFSLSLFYYKTAFCTSQNSTCTIYRHEIMIAS